MPSIGEPWATKTEGADEESIFALAYAREPGSVSDRDGVGSSSVFLCRMKEDIQTAPGG
ncbi:MAG TPA: hypothetical protein VFF17_03315 [Thermoanaerobaculia bacterium]|nr:hypothetical protein [Thermoanaerobaculia bacterium]